MTGLIPLLIALALVEAATSQGPAPAFSDAVAAVGLVVGGAVAAEVAARLLVRRRVGWERVDVIAQTLILAAFAGLCLGTGWVRWAPSTTVALLPWMALHIAWWWSSALAMPGWTRRGHVVHQLRFGLMPLALLLPIADLCDFLGRAWRIDWWMDTHLGHGATMAGSFLLMAGILVLLPAVLVRLWGARPLADAELATLLGEECRRLGVPVAGVLAWPTEGGRVHNAVVLGLLPRLRWVLLTDDLLRDVGPQGLRAVLGHELGHARHRHLLLYLLFAAAGGMASWAVSRGLLDLSDQVPWLAGVPAQVRQAIIAVALLGVIWRVLFGVVSRQCERQADLAAVEATGDPRHLEEALLTVAAGAGVDPRTPSWRHYSIAERIAFAYAAAADPAVAARHHRVVRRLAGILVLVTALLGLTLVTCRPFAPPI